LACARLCYGLSEPWNNRLVNLRKIEEKLQGPGDIVAERPGEPRLIMNFEQLHAAHKYMLFDRESL